MVVNCCLPRHYAATTAISVIYARSARVAARRTAHLVRPTNVAVVTCAVTVVRQDYYYVAHAWFCHRLCCIAYGRAH